MLIDETTEWLEADGRGGFASGTTSGTRTRRYHALLLTAMTPPTGRVVLVNGHDVWLDTPHGSYALSTQRYAPGVTSPDGALRIVAFTTSPWPTWTFRVSDGTEITQEIFVDRRTAATVVTWSVTGAPGPVVLRVRPFLSGRDYHALHHENGALRAEAERVGAAVVVRPYDGLPAISMVSNGAYRHAPEWYRQFLYSAEQDRGLDAVEDLASPGEFSWSVSERGDPAVWVLTADTGAAARVPTRDDALALVSDARRAELARRAAFGTRLDEAADAYLVRRGAGRTIVAGYPWFTDWGRDTFIAVRGLCLATDRLAEARDILVEWAGAVSDGMLPNRFADTGTAPEFNSVDASLWYVVAVHELLDLVSRPSRLLTAAQRKALQSAVVQIVAGYASGTRFGIRMDTDGLLAAGVPGVQLTWMDAKVGDWVVTPRVGKPVEIEALWLNALWIASGFDARWREPFERGRTAFLERFWREDLGRLADVIDVDHVRGTRDDTFRPNQIFAVGGLPLALLDGPRARRLVDGVEQALVTPLGLRSLAPGETGYAPRYEGSPAARDAVYHQGTVWPWLIGAFVDAWLKVRPRTGATRREARERFLAPLLAHLDRAGLGHVSEIADADAPFAPRGCPFQAWSVGELLRLERVVLREPAVLRASQAGETMGH
ncbi:MAG: amylo-alpha-1,6-glucosidase [Acidobacteriota bacterium]